MELSGIAKVVLLSVLDFYVLYLLAGVGPAVLICGIMLIIVVAGEYIDVLRNHGVGMDNLSDGDRSRLTYILNHLTDRFYEIKGAKIGKVKLYVISDDNINAFSFGFRCIGITSGLLRSVDDAVLCGVLSHEISHRRHLDAVFNRIVFMNIIMIMVILSIAAVLSSVMVWIVLLLLCLFGICRGGFVSFFIADGVSKVSKAFYSGLQRIIVFCYQTVMGFVSRHCEYRADKEAACIGYAQQLKYFLSRFGADMDRQGIRRLTDVLYATHPVSCKRIARLEKYTTDISMAGKN